MQGYRSWTLHCRRRGELLPGCYQRRCAETVIGYCCTRNCPLPRLLMSLDIPVSEGRPYTAATLLPYPCSRCVAMLLVAYPLQGQGVGSLYDYARLQK